MSRRSLDELNATRDAKAFGENIIRRRQETGWSQRRLAAEAGISRQTLIRIENGFGCTPYVERKLCKPLGALMGTLWERRERSSVVLHTPNERWFFVDVEDAVAYLR